MDRRTFLKGGGVITVAVLGGGVWRAYDHGVFSTGHGPAYEPWKDWRTASGNGPLALVRAAILAASPHNTQPWLFKVSNSAIELYIDTTRNVGPLDPYLREEHIGMGCALENLMQAAAANGYQAAITLAVCPASSQTKQHSKPETPRSSRPCSRHTRTKRTVRRDPEPAYESRTLHSSRGSPVRVHLNPEWIGRPGTKRKDLPFPRSSGARENSQHQFRGKFRNIFRPKCSACQRPVDSS